ncbi:MAG: hypothetical protein WBB82_01025 [Limnothrix sp.]
MQNSPSDKASAQQDPEKHLKQVCEAIHGEPIHMLFWRVKDQAGNLEIVFRELRRGWYFQVLLLRDGDRYSPERQILPDFLPLLEPNEKLWENLTEKATPEDWLAIDNLILYALTVPDSQLLFADENLIGPKVSEKALDRFGCCVPDSSLLPVFVFENSKLGLNLISYFKDPDRFAGENLVQDNTLNQCEAVASIYQAQARLKQKIDHYSQS